MGTDCIGSCKSNYHTTTTAPQHRMQTLEVNLQQTSMLHFRINSNKKLFSMWAMNLFSICINKIKKNDNDKQNTTRC